MRLPLGGAEPATKQIVIACQTALRTPAEHEVTNDSPVSDCYGQDVFHVFSLPFGLDTALGSSE